MLPPRILGRSGGSGRPRPSGCGRGLAGQVTALDGSRFQTRGLSWSLGGFLTPLDCHLLPCLLYSVLPPFISSRGCLCAPHLLGVTKTTHIYVNCKWR